MSEMQEIEKWPECVGMQGKEAEAYIKGKFKGEVQLVPFGHATIANLDFNRVFIYLDQEGKVEDVPQIG